MYTNVLETMTDGTVLPGARPKRFLIDILAYSTKYSFALDAPGLITAPLVWN